MIGEYKKKVVKGMMWSSFQKFGTIIISFVSNIILARLLSPDDYGCIGLLAIFITLSSTFINGGFGSALIQKKNPTEADYSTIFYFNVLVSILLYFLLYFTAPAIAQFYKIDLLTKVLRVEGLVVIINSLIIVQENRLRKNLQFRKLSVAYLVPATVSAGITIYLAYIGWGVWALVSQRLIMASITALMLWFLSEWKPKLLFSLTSLKELFSFGFFVLLADIINTIGNNIQGILIGRVYNASTMGYYSQAHKLDQIASTSISSIINQVSYPVLSEVQNDHSAMVRIMSRFNSVLAYITFPVMLLLILLAKPIIIIVYSAKWLDSVPYFQILCLAGIATCLQGINYYAVAAVGKSRMLMWWTVAKRIVGVILIVVGLFLFGMTGLLVGMVLSSYFIYLVNSYLVDRNIGYSFKQQIRDISPIIAVSVFSFVASYLSTAFIDMSVYLEGCIRFVAFVIPFVFISALFKMDSYLEFRGIVTNIIKKRKGKR
ncbi:MAG: lipopolysaccharide biosynthesis protein [Bacteroidales bacterium]|nr:lipopolysaccharide biosynthesis protein [Bacteroidales bacterium]